MADAFGGIDGDDAQTVLYDVQAGRSAKQSRLTYTKELLAFRREVEREWEEWQKANPTAILDVPSELPRADIKLPKQSIKAKVKESGVERRAGQGGW